MAVVFTEDYEGISDNTTLTTSNTAWIDFTGAAMTAQTEQYKSGSVSGYLSTSANNSTTTYDYSTGTSTFYMRFYIRPVTLSGAYTSISQVFQYSGGVDTSAPVAQLRAYSDGGSPAKMRLQLRDKYSALTTTADITTGDWHRLEWKVTPNASTGTQELRVFSGTKLEADVSDYSAIISGNCRVYGTNCCRWSFGSAINETIAYYFDDNAIDTATWCGSSVTTTEKSSSDSGVFGLSTESAGNPLVVLSPTDSGVLGLSAESRSFAISEMSRSDSGIFALGSESASAVPDTAETLGQWYMSIKPRLGVW